MVKNSYLNQPTGYQVEDIYPNFEESDSKTLAAFSPDFTLFHTKRYLDFAEEAGNNVRLISISKSHGSPLAIFPLHTPAKGLSTTGYSGVLFPSGDSSVSKGITAIGNLFKANPRLQLTGFQSPLCAAASDFSRIFAIQSGFSSFSNRTNNLFTRIIKLSYKFDGIEEMSIDDPVSERLLETFDPKIRSQIRKAIRDGCKVVTNAPATYDEFHIFLENWMPIQSESWNRTGMAQHTEKYWKDLFELTVLSGGQLICVLIQDRTQNYIAGAIGQSFSGSCLYLSGASTEQGLKLNANPLALSSLIQKSACFGDTIFEIGRFSPTETNLKVRRIDMYKAQFGGYIQVVPNFDIGSIVTRRTLQIRNNLYGRFK